MLLPEECLQRLMPAEYNERPYPGYIDVDFGQRFMHEFSPKRKGKSASYYWPRLFKKEGYVLVNDALNTFYLRLYGVGHMIKDHSDSERRNLLPPHRLLFPISSKGSFICIIPQTG